MWAAQTPPFVPERSARRRRSANEGLGERHNASFEKLSKKRRFQRNESVSEPTPWQEATPTKICLFFPPKRQDQRIGTNRRRGWWWKKAKRNRNKPVHAFNGQDHQSRWIIRHLVAYWASSKCKRTASVVKAQVWRPHIGWGEPKHHNFWTKLGVDSDKHTHVRIPNCRIKRSRKGDWYHWASWFSEVLLFKPTDLHAQ